MSEEQELAIGEKRQSAEEHLARELLRYFTGLHPPGLNYEDQPSDVQELWLGAARVAIRALQIRSDY